MMQAVITRATSNAGHCNVLFPSVDPSKLRQRHLRSAAAVAADYAPKQTWDAADYATHGAFNHSSAAVALQMLSPQPGERILDLGCGDGVVTRNLVEAGCKVTGVDASLQLLDAARASSSDVRWVLADGQALDIEQQFDAVFSHAALHWMREDPSAVMHGVRRALLPGGRFIADCGGAGNVLSVRTAFSAVLADYGVDASAGNPWHFSSDTAARRRLEDAGFQVESIGLTYKPTEITADIGGWLDTFCQSYFDLVPPEQRAEVRRRVAAALAQNVQVDGKYVLDYVRLRFKAIVAA